MQSKTHRIVVDGGMFRVYELTPAQIRTTHFSGGDVSQVSAPASQVIPGYDESVFYAWHDEGDSWNCDINCGFQRWFGWKSTRQIAAALRKCGFATKEVSAFLRKLRKGETNVESVNAGTAAAGN